MRHLRFTWLLAPSMLIAGIELAAADDQPAKFLTLDAVVLRPMVEAEVPARQTGVLSTIAVEEGASVKAGDSLASLDDRAAKLAVQKAELEREQVFAQATNELRIHYAEKALEVARAELKRSQESIDKFAKSISESQVDVERLTVDKLELERKQAEHDVALEKFELRLKENSVEAAKLDLELHAIRAPFDGVVALVRGRTGEWVQPGTIVLRLVAIDSLRAEGFAPSDVVDDGMIGSPVRFAIDGPADDSLAPLDAQSPNLLKGVLRFVSPEIDPVTRQVRVWAEIDNASRTLRPGQQGRLLLHLKP